MLQVDRLRSIPVDKKGDGILDRLHESLKFSWCSSRCGCTLHLQWHSYRYLLGMIVGQDVDGIIDGLLGVGNTVDVLASVDELAICDDIVDVGTLLCIIDGLLKVENSIGKLVCVMYLAHAMP